MGVNRNTSQPDPPKRPLTAFFIYKADQFDTVRKENPDAKVTEITKILCQKWVSLDQETKQRYDNIHRQERERYEREIKEYEEKYGPIEKKKRKAIKRQHDSDESEEEQQKGEEEVKEEEESPNKSYHAKLPTRHQDKPAPPQKPLIAFFIYKAFQFDTVKKENPDAKVAEITKIIRQKWVSLDQETKQQYDKMHQQERERYEREIKEYEEKYGPSEKKKRKATKRQHDSDESEKEQQKGEEEVKEEEESPNKSYHAKLPTRHQDKPAPPKRPLTAFFIYKQDVSDEVKKNNPDARIVEITKIIAEKWRDLDQETKQQYDNIHRQERERYEREIKEYEEKYGPSEKKKRKATKRQHDSDESEEEQQKGEEEVKEEEESPNKSCHAKSPTRHQDKPAPPKRPLTAFLIYKLDVFDKVKENNPDARIVEVTKIIAEKWRNLDQQSRLQYEKKSIEAKELYEKEMKEYEAKYGPIEKRRRGPFRDQNGGASNPDAEDDDRRMKKLDLAQDDDEDEDDLGEPCNKVFI